jgi:hypothetical protein
VKDSPTIEMLDICWRYNRKATGFSWLRLNSSMRDALFVAVEAGLPFAEDDMAAMMERFNMGRWIGAEGTEMLYARAVAYGHKSAWQAIEKHRGRRPFIVKGATLRNSFGHGASNQPMSRVTVGTEFVWQGVKVKCNSFNDKLGVMHCASYRWEETCPPCPKCGLRGYGKQVLVKKFTISHADIRAARAAEKAAAKEAK